MDELLQPIIMSDSEREYTYRPVLDAEGRVNIRFEIVNLDGITSEPLARRALGPDRVLGVLNDVSAWENFRVMFRAAIACGEAAPQPVMN